MLDTAPLERGEQIKAVMFMNSRSKHITVPEPQLKKAIICLQVEVDGVKVEVSGQWNLASPLLPLTINGTDRMLQVMHTQRVRML